MGAGGVLIWLIMETGFMMFSEREEWYLPAASYLMKKYWLKPKLSQVEGRRLCVILLYVRFSDAISHFSHFSNFKIDLLLQFLRNHPQTFRICFRHVNEENDPTEFWFRPINRNYGILKILDPFFWTIF